MQRIKLGLMIAGALVTVNSPGAMAFSQTLSWEQSLISQYPKGAVLMVLLPGIVGTTGCGVSGDSTFKDGQLHPPGFGQNLTLATLKCLTQSVTPGTQVSLGDMKVFQKSNQIGFAVTQCINGNCSFGVVTAQVHFEFPKGFMAAATLEQIQEPIGHVFSVVGGPHAPASAAAGLEEIAGLYVMTKATDNHLQLNADGTLSLVQGGRNYSGSFTMNGNKLMMRTGTSAPLQAGILEGDTIVDPNGSAWVRQRAGPAAVAQLPPPPPQALNLPSIYVNAQTPADQLQLNADNSFSLQEAGQTYRGAFAVNSNILEVNIDANTKTRMTIQGNTLTDASGQTWALQAQSVPTASSGPALRNEDIIKLAKVGIDDATILAKIESSKCQFDTSTDALIQLKESGVSAAVLKAMVGAGK